METRKQPKLVCSCGRKMTPEVGHWHMAECEAVPPAVRELNRYLGELLDAGDYEGYQKATAAMSAHVPLWKRLRWTIWAIKDFFRS